MEKVTVFLFIIIVVYLAYSFIKSKKRSSAGPVEKEKEEKRSIDKTRTDNKNDEYEKAVTAAIAAVMSGRAYRIKNIFLAHEDENDTSKWKVAGRQESMMKRSFFRKV